MTLRLAGIRPVANGLSTDHPIPDLPFVDDSHLPADPDAIEAIGRDVAADMWGRWDPVRSKTGVARGWVAFTTDPTRHDLAWLVRYHPEHGRSVIVYRDNDVAGVHIAYWDTALLFRAGDYWWDGATWYRPSQIADMAAERYVDRPVPGAATVTAADLLRTGGDSRHAHRLTTIDQVVPDAPASARWLNELVYWAEHRPGNRPLERCVVKLTAPELSGGELIGISEMAEITGLAASTLRAYIARGENDVPAPQAVVAGRSMWSRPVAEEYAEQRRASSDGTRELLYIRREDEAELPPGISTTWDRYAKIFFSQMWDRPLMRKRWALRWRTEDHIREVSRTLSWLAAADITHVVPIQALAFTTVRAIEQEIATGHHLRRALDGDESIHYAIHWNVTKTLAWLLRFNPDVGIGVITTAAGEVERNLSLPRDVVRRTFHYALTSDGGFDQPTACEIIDRYLPQTTPEQDR